MFAQQSNYQIANTVSQSLHYGIGSHIHRLYDKLKIENKYWECLNIILKIIDKGGLDRAMGIIVIII